MSNLFIFLLAAELSINNDYSRRIIDEAKKATEDLAFQGSELVMRTHEGKVRAEIVSITHTIESLLNLRSYHIREPESLLRRIQSLEEIPELIDVSASSMTASPVLVNADAGPSGITLAASSLPSGNTMEGVEE